MAGVAIGQISGFGALSYELGVRAVIDHVRRAQDKQCHLADGGRRFTNVRNFANVPTWLEWSPNHGFGALSYEAGFGNPLTTEGHGISVGVGRISVA